MGKQKTQGKKDIYLREVKILERFIENILLEIFQGNIEEDKAYWIKHQNAISVRYFKLKDVRNSSQP